MAGITLCHAGQTWAALATKETQRQANPILQTASGFFATVRLRRYKLEVLTMAKLFIFIGCLAFIVGASMVPDTTSAFAAQVALLYGGLITAVWAGIASR